jgi:hypothetical protein
MSALEVVLTVGGYVLSVITYLAGLRHGRQQRAEDRRESRIQNVVDNYMANRSNIGQIRGLLKAGAPGLKSNSEVQEVCERIVASNEQHPIEPNVREHVDECDLLRFLKELNRNSQALRNSQLLIEFAIQFGGDHGPKV